MPVTGKPVFDENERASWFSHKSEVAKPNYYRVYLADYDVVAELTPTERAAIMRFTYPATDSAFVVVDAFDKNSSIEFLPDQNKIIGYTTRNNGGVPSNFKNYFVIELDRPYSYKAIEESGAVVGFSTGRGDQVNLRVASSFISPEQAEQNLKEVSGTDFDAVRANGRDRWNDVLGRIAVEDDNIDNLRTFYSCLYRSLLFPRCLSEITADGKVVHYSPYNGKVCEGHMYTDTGFWDTFRSLFPLLNLLYPSESLKMQEGLANAYKESGFLPEWASPGHRDCMVGNNSASVVADAYLKGVRSPEIETLWEAVMHGANSAHPQIRSTGRLGFDLYNKLGYVPCDAGINESAARTLEYAYDDWCIYQLGKALGKPEKELAPYKKHAMNYANLFNPDFKLMSGRKSDGSFKDNFNPLKWGDEFTEGNSWHYTWSVFHDPAGLIALMGGRKEFNQMMDSVFILPPVFDASYYGIVIHEIREMQIMNTGNYAHGNQPIQHMIYLYDYSGQPWKAQKHVREVMRQLYTCAPDGYCGDEDNGQTSAWYVFSALGFYPVCPGSNQYAMGSPLFKKATLTLENGKRFVISANGNADDNVYISHAKLNGKAMSRTYLNHADLTAGGNLDLDMASTPNTSRGTAKQDAPYSFSNKK